MRPGQTVVFTHRRHVPAGTDRGQDRGAGLQRGGDLPVGATTRARTGVPDSTARDFDAIGARRRARASSAIAGARRAGDAIGCGRSPTSTSNRSFEPDDDLLAPADTTLALTAERPVARGPRASGRDQPARPGRSRGTVLDSLARRRGRGPGDRRRRERHDARGRRSVERPRGQFEMQLEPGTLDVRAFRDLDGNRAWAARRREPASDACSPIQSSRPAGSRGRRAGRS